MDKFEAHVRAQLQAGTVGKVFGQDQDQVIAYLPGAEDGRVTILYDTADGHEVRVPYDDRQYMLAKARPKKKGERVVWKRAGKGLLPTAPSGVVPAYSEIPVVVGSEAPSLAATGEAKAQPRKRKRRGSRGARRRRQLAHVS